MLHPIGAYIFIGLATVAFVGFFAWKIGTQERAIREAERRPLESAAASAVVETNALPAPSPAPTSVSTTTGAIVATAASASASSDAGPTNAPSLAVTHPHATRATRRSGPSYSPHLAADEPDDNPYDPSLESAPPRPSPSAAATATEPHDVFEVRQ